MKNPANAPLTFNDIVFEGRNKLYGAYLLRQIYHRHLVLATFIAISLFMLFLSIPLIARLISPTEYYPIIEATIDDDITFTQVVLPPLEKQKQIEVAPPPAEKTATEKFTDIKIVDN